MLAAGLVCLSGLAAAQDGGSGPPCFSAEADYPLLAGRPQRPTSIGVFNGVRFVPRPLGVDSDSGLRLTFGAGLAERWDTQFRYTSFDTLRGRRDQGCHNVS